MISSTVFRKHITEKGILCCIINWRCLEYTCLWVKLIIGSSNCKKNPTFPRLLQNLWFISIALSSMITYMGLSFIRSVILNLICKLTFRFIINQLNMATKVSLNTPKRKKELENKWHWTMILEFSYPKSW